MSDPKNAPAEKPQKKRLNQGQILILVMGALVIAYAISMIFGNSLSNYEQLKQGAIEQSQDATPAATPAAPNN